MAENVEIYGLKRKIETDRGLKETEECKISSSGFVRHTVRGKNDGKVDSERIDYMR